MFPMGINSKKPFLQPSDLLLQKDPFFLSPWKNLCFAESAMPCCNSPCNYTLQWKTHRESEFPSSGDGGDLGRGKTCSPAQTQPGQNNDDNPELLLFSCLFKFFYFFFHWNTPPLAPWRCGTARTWWIGLNICLFLPTCVLLFPSVGNKQPFCKHSRPLLWFLRSTGWEGGRMWGLAGCFTACHCPGTHWWHPGWWGGWRKFESFPFGEIPRPQTPTTSTAKTDF